MRSMALEAAPSTLAFNGWGRCSCTDLSRRLIVRSTSDGEVPFVVSAPQTARFRVSKVESDLPLMAVIGPRATATYVIEFVPPEQHEADYLWENFRDLVD